MTISSQHKRKSYRRDDGVLMVEFRPGQFVNEHVAFLLERERANELLVSISEDSHLPSRRGSHRVQTRGREDAR
jgi:hypothetical protein